jgi:cytoskeletal protein CcmA (bactofilin family)
VVFRRDSKVDAFQRQLSALRHQLGGEADDPDERHAARLPAVDDDDLPFPFEAAASAASTRGSFLIPREPVMPAAPDPVDPAALAIPALDERTSVLSHTTAWKGDLDSTGSLHVHGRVDGSLTARDAIYIAEEAVVDADVRAATVTIAGSVRGSVLCTDRFEVLPRGRVAGEIRAPVVVIHEGALLTGDIAMTSAGDTGRAMRPVARAAQSGD